MNCFKQECAPFITKPESKAFKCSYIHCKFSEEDEVLLKKHISAAHGIASFKCHIDGCGKRFVDRLALKRHQLNYHSEATK